MFNGDDRMGYHILLVDDEELAIRGIERGVDWDSLSVATVFKAHSMQTAVRMLDTYHMDIVLTDIEMPEGSGIELIRWVKKNKPETACIFYTCHAEFSYAQEALRLGAVDYLLKPIPYDELEQILKKTIALLKHQDQRREIDALYENLSEESHDMSAVEQVKQYIAEHISMDILREDLARLVYMNPDYLSRLFKKSEGIGLSEYIIQKKIAFAKKLLKNTRLSVVDIAARTGFSYSSYFIRIFKKKEGMTPEQYRKDCSREESGQSGENAGRE